MTRAPAVARIPPPTSTCWPATTPGTPSPPTTARRLTRGKTPRPPRSTALPLLLPTRPAPAHRTRRTRPSTSTWPGPSPGAGLSGTWPARAPTSSSTLQPCTFHPTPARASRPQPADTLTLSFPRPPAYPGVNQKTRCAPLPSAITPTPARRTGPPEHPSPASPPLGPARSPRLPEHQPLGWPTREAPSTHHPCRPPARPPPPCNTSSQPRTLQPSTLQPSTTGNLTPPQAPTAHPSHQERAPPRTPASRPAHCPHPALTSSPGAGPGTQDPGPSSLPVFLLPRGKSPSPPPPPHFCYPSLPRPSTRGEQHLPTLARAPILASSSGTRPVSRRQIIQATGPLPAPGGRGRATLARAHRPVTRAPSSLPHCSSFSYPPGKPPTPRSLPPFPATRPSHCRAPGQPIVGLRAGKRRRPLRLPELCLPVPCRLGERGCWLTPG